MITEAFVSSAAWLFFAAWGVVIAALTFAAFRRDLFPSRSGREENQKDRV